MSLRARNGSYTDAAPMSATERSARRYVKNREKILADKRDYRHNNSKWQTDEAYLSRPFVAWDGEGITRANGLFDNGLPREGRHDYVMLACKSSDGDSDYLAEASDHGLGTAQIFDFILASAERNPGAINIIFGGGYDFNMFFRDFTRDDLLKLYNRKFYVWNGYRLGWRRGKSFYIGRVDENKKSVGRGVTIFDCVSFFQRPFVQACDEYLGKYWYKRDMIIKNKGLRSSFTPEDIPEVRKYNDAELVNLIELMTELRDRLNKVGLRPRRWDGPGAVAAALLLREHVKAAETVCPPEVAEAARFAYAGGRFELLRYGHVNKPAYEYDINSAYPAGLRNVPNLAKGHWEHVKGDPGPQDFALYHVEYHGYGGDKYSDWTPISKVDHTGNLHVPGPFFYRGPKGTVCWPLNVKGWYWSPEMQSGREYVKVRRGWITVHEAWVFHPSTDERPFAFIDGLYNKRRALKIAGDGANVGIKLGLNSLYGKLCQQVGWEMTDNGPRIPPFHQLEWAGYTTSYCRAEILRACLPHLEAVIAFETDAVFTEVPLDVKIGTELGDFEVTEFTDLTYAQSGVWFGNIKGGKLVEKSRGADRGTLTREAVINALKRPGLDMRVAEATQTRFVGAGVALAQSFDRWRTWETKERQIKCYPTGKRVAYPVMPPTDYWKRVGEPTLKRQIQTLDWQARVGRKVNGWNHTMCSLWSEGVAPHSCEFPIEWINPNPEMEPLSDMREAGNDHTGDEW